jgi:hypothetical protein
MPPIHLAGITMDDHTFENWVKIKKVLEEAGKTDCYFYTRAAFNVKGGKLAKDPFELPILGQQEEE